MRVGVLALQGDFAAHAAMLSPIVDARGGTVPEVRRVHQLSGLDGLVIPGGESTTLLKLMQHEPWFEGLTGFAARGGGILGTCAGAILLARRVLDPDQRSLGLIDATIRRNGFGRQIDSFEAEIAPFAGEAPMRAVFIRAPRFTDVDASVEVMASWNGEPVLIRQKNVIAGTFHPELTADDRLHRWFVDRVIGESVNTTTRLPVGETPALTRT